MFLENKRLIALLTVASFSQMACYNTYFIEKDELRKLESQVDQQEVVVVYGDCKSPASSAAVGDGTLDGSVWAQADEDEGAQESAASDQTASGAAAASAGEDQAAAARGCDRVPVSTANAVSVVSTDKEHYRVTPFNFMMSDQQLVSPEYDLLLGLDEVQGAEVREFSTWKTIATIAGVSAVAIGTFVGISVMAPEGKGFE